MKKKFPLLLLAILTIWTINITSNTVHAESSSSQSEASSLIKNLNFDQGTRVLSGDTAPNANVYLSFTATYFNADDKGHFQITIPEGVDEANIVFLDIIGGESTDLDYRFKEEASSESSTTTTTTTTQAQESEASSLQSSKENGTTEGTVTTMVTSSTTNDSSTPEKTKGSSNLFWFFGALIILLAIISLLFVLRRKKGKHQR